MQNRLLSTRQRRLRVYPATRSPLAALLFTLWFVIEAGCALAETAKTNILFFLIDDLGYMDIGANNPDTFYETPNIDKLARTGMRFTQGYAANPVCSPTRYSIMTGKHPSRVDVTNFFCGNRSARFHPAPLNCQMPPQNYLARDAARGLCDFFRRQMASRIDA